MPRSLDDTEIKEMLARLKAVITGSHVVYTSQKHGSEYVNKDEVYPHTREISDLCNTLMHRIAELRPVNGMPLIPDAVVAPAIGGITLAQRVAEHFSGYWAGSWLDIPAIYAERIEETVLVAKDEHAKVGIFCAGAEDQLGHTVRTEFGKIAMRPLNKGDSLAIKRNLFTIKRGQAKHIAGKTKVLVVEDILNTGGSAALTVKAVREAGGEVVAVGALVNRGGVTAEGLGVPYLVSLLNVTMSAWDETECPLCPDTPINTEVGHGKEFLARKHKAT